MNKIVIIGSTNVDKTLHVKRYAEGGETLSIDSPQIITGGGKGANQAIAAARSNAETTFVTKIGQEADADMMLKTFQEANINTDYIEQTPKAETGKAYITVNEHGQNMIYVYGGANSLMSPLDAKNAEQVISTADFVISQLEIPIPAIEEAFKIARKHNVTTVLNPAPAKQLPDSLISLTDVIVPNETESALLSGIKITDTNSLIENAKYFFSYGLKTVLITVGAKGAFWATPNDHGFVDAFKVKAIDTTAAGDTFIGALFSQLLPDQTNLVEAMTYANRASSIIVQRPGAQTSIPTNKEIINSQDK